MAVSKMSVTFPCQVEKVWQAVTSLTACAWRSDLSRIEVLSDTQFVEYTTDGYPTTFTTTAMEPCRRWEFDLENGNITGHWTGLFTQKDGHTLLELTEDVTAKKFFMRPFVKAYLKKQQARYIADLKQALGYLMPGTFLERSIALLEEIDASPEKLEWCKRYSVYAANPGQDDLAQSLHGFKEQAYESGLVITNYHQVIQQYNLDEASIINAEPSWLKEQSYLPTLACIAYHFRRDHFNEGSLISKSIASGAMLRMLQHLKSQSLGGGVATTLETLYRFECRGIPDAPGVYWVLAPEGLPIRFEPAAPNAAAPFYSVDVLTQKYAGCKDKQVLYIGKASGKKGLRQRLKQYMKYGWNEANNHKGGRAIWQIQNAGMLLLAYEPCSDCAAREHQLLRDYKTANGCYPLANWRG